MLGKREIPNEWNNRANGKSKKEMIDTERRNSKTWLPFANGFRKGKSMPWDRAWRVCAHLPVSRHRHFERVNCGKTDSTVSTLFWWISNCFMGKLLYITSREWGVARGSRKASLGERGRRRSTGVEISILGSKARRHEPLPRLVMDSAPECIYCSVFVRLHLYIHDGNRLQWTLLSFGESKPKAVICECHEIESFEWPVS